MKKMLFTTGMLLCFLLAQAQPPTGYYSSARGKNGASLKTAMWNIIKGPNVVSYKNLQTVYAVADIRPDGKVYDIYSNITNYSLDDFNTGNGSEGQGLNKEHSFPKSWFGGKVSPMYSDAFHVVPSDAYLNNMRSNLPYGETKSPKKMSANGFSKKGPSSISGYTGDVFEPNDEYKGDLARIYFYMATCYEDKITGWSSPMLSGSSKYSPYASWAMDMLLRWAEMDPVSQKEINRNNAVYSKQGNRNPFVDFPGLEDYIWGRKQGESFDPDNYNNTSVDTDAPERPLFSLADGVVEAGTTVSISCPTAGATIHYTLNGGAEQQGASPVNVVITETTNIVARAELNGHYSSYSAATYTVKQQAHPGQGTVFNIITSASELVVGREYIVVCESKQTALGAQNNDIRSRVDVVASDGTVDTETGTDSTPHVLTLGGTAGAWTLYDAVEGTYLALNSAANKLHAVAEANTDNARWYISFRAGTAHINNKMFPDRGIQYNAGSPRFACYTGSQQDVSLYMREQAEEPKLPDAPVFSVESGEVMEGTEVLISAGTPAESAVICYTINGGDEQRGASPVSITVDEDMTIIAYAVVGDEASETVTATYFLSDEDDADAPAVPEFSVPSGTYTDEFELEITCPTEDALIYYSINGGPLRSDSSPLTLSIEESCTVMAYSELDGEVSARVTANYVFVTDGLQRAVTAPQRVDVRAIDGRLLRSGVPADKATENLPSGVYIVNHTKVMVR